MMIASSLTPPPFTSPIIELPQTPLYNGESLSEGIEEEKNKLKIAQM